MKKNIFMAILVGCAFVATFFLGGVVRPAYAVIGLIATAALASAIALGYALGNKPERKNDKPTT